MEEPIPRLTYPPFRSNTCFKQTFEIIVLFGEAPKLVWDIQEQVTRRLENFSGTKCPAV